MQNLTCKQKSCSLWRHSIDAEILKYGQPATSYPYFIFEREKNGDLLQYRVGDYIAAGSQAKIFNLVPLEPRYKTKALKYYLSARDAELEIHVVNRIGKKLPVESVSLLKPFKFFENNLAIMQKFDGSLVNFFKKNPGWDQRLDAMQQLINNLAFLQRKRIFHGDIHPGNILYRNKTKRIFCLADFGSGFLLQKNTTNKVWGPSLFATGPEMAEVGSLQRAKKITQRNLLCKAIDVRCLGAVLCCICIATNQVEFSSLSSHSGYSVSEYGHVSLKQLTNKDKKKYQIPKPIFKLIKGMMEPDPSKRHTIKRAAKIINMFMLNFTREQESLKRKSKIKALEAVLFAE